MDRLGRLYISQNLGGGRGLRSDTVADVSDLVLQPQQLIKMIDCDNCRYNFKVVSVCR